jgi:hypothetical protein
MSDLHNPEECCCPECCYKRQEAEKLMSDFRNACDIISGGTKSVRTKFKVDSIERALWGDGREIQTVKLSVVYGASEENKAFWKATPAGQITLSCVNPETAAQFELSGEVYVDFTPVED